ncbi:MAG: DUF2085 domain-containing protein [Ignavibacteria bacterium]|nr:DUF2085 domain-containing protein [Ignavibacteria bacterium]
MKRERYPLVIYLIIALISLIWCFGIVAAPIFANESGFKKEVSDFFYIFYEKSCHQIKERSFVIKGNQFGVCSRCTAIYFGFFIGTIFYPLFKKLNNINLPSIWILVMSAGLMFIDAAGDIAGIYKNTFISREITGGIVGLLLPFYIIPGTVRIFYEFFNRPDLNRIKKHDHTK